MTTIYQILDLWKKWWVDLIKNNLYYREICTLHLAGKMLINKGIVLKLTTSAAENSKVAVDVIKKGKSSNLYSVHKWCPILGEGVKNDQRKLVI